MPTHTATQLITEAKSVMDTASATGKFNREVSDRVDKLLRMAELSRSALWQAEPGPVTQNYLKLRMERILDPATRQFFGGARFADNVISESGAVIDVSQHYQVNGRSVGRVTELRDHSNFFEQRSALTEGTLGDGGSLVPVGYVPEVLHAAKRTDQVLEAGNWDLAATATGGPLNIPSLNDTGTSALKVSELGAQTFANPSFSQVTNSSTAFPNATTWSSQVVKASKQLLYGHWRCAGRSDNGRCYCDRSKRLA